MVLVGVGCDCVVCMSWRMGRWAREMNRKAQVKRVTTTRRPQASEWQSWWTDLNRRRRYLEVSWADMVVGWLVWWLRGLLGWTHVGWVPWSVLGAAVAVQVQVPVGDFVSVVDGSRILT